MFITVLFFLCTYCRSNVQQEYYIFHEKVLGMSLSGWGLVALVLTFVGFLLMITSLTISSWITTTNFSGGLYRCENCNHIKYLGWDCLQGSTCSINSNSTNCNTYKELYEASQLFISFEAAAIIFLALFIQSLTAYIRGRDYGNKYANYVSII